MKSVGFEYVSEIIDGPEYRAKALADINGLNENDKIYPGLTHHKLDFELFNFKLKL